MSLQLTVVPDKPEQIVLDVRDKRKPQQTALPLTTTQSIQSGFSL